jgi:hypothetical protein
MKRFIFLLFLVSHKIYSLEVSICEYDFNDDYKCKTITEEKPEPIVVVWESDSEREKEE